MQVMFVSSCRGWKILDVDPKKTFTHTNQMLDVSLILGYKKSGESDARDRCLANFNVQEQHQKLAS
jgi:hypothetical protein